MAGSLPFSLICLHTFDLSIPCVYNIILFAFANMYKIDDVKLFSFNVIYLSKMINNWFIVTIYHCFGGFCVRVLGPQLNEFG